MGQGKFNFSEEFDARLPQQPLHLHAMENGTLHQSQRRINEVLSTMYSKMFHLYVLTHKMSFYRVFNYK